ncbi:MAG: DUF1232 domain-containing protein [Selenomonadaceae bacterium]|nr:DUF1232 domain-containing protein [Selenomonadaceae bacterium]
MGRIFGLLKVFRRDLMVMMIAAYNKKTPLKVKFLALMAFCYVISPIDALPETVPFAGLIDDMVIIPAATYGLKKMLPKDVAKSSEEKADRAIKKGGMIVLAAALIILFWIVLIGCFLYWLIWG